ncbi:MAG TPA: DUF3341 domain-containing protein [Cytophagales bacterium]|nr:DUF3341 domain-containing protein [Cytophagales bacterium]
MEKEKSFLLGVFEDEDVLLHSIKDVRSTGVKIHEVFSPFPVHGLDEALGYKRSRLPIAAFLFGMMGTSLALFMMYWMNGYDWPMIIGGKPYSPLPTFIPITFEATVLISSFGMVTTFLLVCNLKPYGKPRIFDIRSTDDKHVMTVDLVVNNKRSVEELSKILKDSGASEIIRKDFN